MSSIYRAYEIELKHENEFIRLYLEVTPLNGVYTNNLIIGIIMLKDNKLDRIQLFNLMKEHGILYERNFKITENNLQIVIINILEKYYNKLLKKRTSSYPLFIYDSNILTNDAATKRIVCDMSETYSFITNIDRFNDGDDCYMFVDAMLIDPKMQLQHSHTISLLFNNR